MTELLALAVVPPQNLVQRAIVDVSALGAKLAYPDASPLVRQRSRQASNWSTPSPTTRRPGTSSGTETRSMARTSFAECVRWGSSRSSPLQVLIEKPRDRVEQVAGFRQTGIREEVVIEAVVDKEL